ncbi:MAG TPA: hypothetical protein VFA02_08305 [Pseudacidobacterium sp.]|nr:hypothetical protein [Pseudacidobacterium sp.]
MSRKYFAAAFLISWFLLGAVHLNAGEKKWQTGTLLSVEHREQPAEMTKRERTETSTDSNGNTSSTTTTTLAPGYVHQWIYYTISTEKSDYVVRQEINFPWTKTVKAETGDTIQCAVDGKKLYIKNPDGNTIKTDIMKTTAHIAAPSQSPQN